LKRGKGSNSHIILVPQPSEDPNDPLNWPQWEKELCLATIAFGSIVNAAVFGPLLSAATVAIALKYNVTITASAELSGYQLLVVGATGPFVSSISRKWGKRPVFIFSSLMGLIGTIVGGCASNYNALLTGRILQGFATSAYESISLATVGDMYFVHERGSRLSIINFILAAISNFVAVIAGPIAANLGVDYNFWILIPFSALQLIMLLLFVPETCYRRASIYNIDESSAENLAQLSELEKRAHEHSEKDEPGVQRTTTTDSGYRPPPPRKSYWKRLAVVTGTYTKDNVVKMLLANIVIISNLGASWVIFISGLCVAWYVAVSFIAATILSFPPYNFNAAQVGYFSVGAFIGGILASLFIGFSSDPSIKYLAGRNHGVYEPEFRIWQMIPGSIFTIAGLYGFGYGAQSAITVYGLAAIHGIMLFGITIIAICTTNYALDSYREHSTEIYIMSMIFKNFFFYGLSTFVNNWLADSGPGVMFLTFGSITVGLCLTSIPMYIYGKRYRGFWHRHNIIRILRLDTDHAGAE